MFYIRDEEFYSSFESISSFHPSNPGIFSLYKKRFNDLCNSPSLNFTFPPFSILYHEFYYKRIQNQIINPNIQNINVQIIGGGIVGLVHAIEAYSLGYNVSIIEKQNNYSRNIWFDLYGEPWSSSLTTIRKWGVLNNNLHFIFHSERIISVRSQILERYLSRIAYLLDINMYFGYMFKEYNIKDSIYYSKIINNNGSIQYIPFNILIAADGGRSIVRNYMNISYNPISRVNIDNTEYLLPKNLNQKAIIIRLQPNNNGECPNEAINPNTGETVYPWDITFQMPKKGITQVYKRFFDNYCELQIFLDSQQEIILHKDGKEIYNWEILLEIVNNCIQTNYQSVLDFQQDIIVSNNNMSIRTINIEIKKVNSSVIYPIEGNNKFPIVILVGDAALTSHFRLGIGINAVFDQLLLFNTLLTNICNNSTIHNAIQLYETKSNEKLYQLGQFEVLSILYEAYCDFLVFIDPHEPSLLDSMMTYGKDYKIQDYNQYPYQKKDILTKCITKF